MKRSKPLEVHWHKTAPLCSKACRRDFMGILTGPAADHVCPQGAYLYWGCCCRCWFHCAVAFEMFDDWNVPEDVGNLILSYVSDQHFTEEFTGPASDDPRQPVYCCVCLK